MARKVFRNNGTFFLLSAVIAAMLVSATCAPNPGSTDAGESADRSLLIPFNDALEPAAEPPQPAPAETFNNLSYIPEGTPGRHAKHVLDLTVPSGNGPFPLVIFLHGGAFSGGSKADVASTASAPNTAGSKGYAVASIGYRLSGDTGGKFPGSFNDILTAIRFLRSNAAQYKLDPNRFAVTGFSAGGYHAGMVCAISGYDGHDLDGFTNLYPGVSTKVQACVTYAGLSDMARLEEHEKMNTDVNYMFANHGAGSPESVFLNITGALKDQPAGAGTIRFRANPLSYVSKNTPPLMMIHATNDNVVPWQQSELLVNEVNKAASGRAVFDKQTTGGHSGFSGRADAIYKFLDEKMPASGNSSVREPERVVR